MGIRHDSERGEGPHTGLGQRVWGELAWDWRKVTLEAVTAGRNLARKRVWGDMSTGGSRGIRGSHDYVRRGGAAARMMLMQAAADGWQVPVGELTVANGVISHAASSRTVRYGQVATAAAKPPPPDANSIKPQDPRARAHAGETLRGVHTRAFDTTEAARGNGRGCIGKTASRRRDRANRSSDRPRLQPCMESRGSRTFRTSPRCLPLLST